MRRVLGDDGYKYWDIDTMVVTLGDNRPRDSKLVLAALKGAISFWLAITIVVVPIPIFIGNSPGIHHTIGVVLFAVLGGFVAIFLVWAARYFLWFPR
jgi:hypothetical protein